MSNDQPTRTETADIPLPATSPRDGDKQGPLVVEGDFWVRRDNLQQDLVIVRDVYEQDAYRTREIPRPDSQAGDEIVVDVGAHIGCFAQLWHRRNPEARIFCVEACPENLDALRANVGSFAEVVHAACTYQPGPVALLNAVWPECESTGGSVVLPEAEIESLGLPQVEGHYWKDLRELPKVTLEDLMGRFGFNRIDVLKLDCEGSEYSILGQTLSLDRIRLIVGEYHDRRRWEAFSQERMGGWDYQLLSDGGEANGLFRATNPAWPLDTLAHQRT